MQPDFPTPRIAAAVNRLAEGLDVPPDLLNPTIVEPGAPGNDAQIPYARVDRTPAGPLQLLAAAVAQAYNLELDRLISRAGAVVEEGAACLFQLADNPGDPAGERWIAAARGGPTAHLRLRERSSETAARAEHEEAVRWLAR